MMSAGVLIGVATVLIEACGFSSRALTATSIACGSRSGSSPCTLTKTSPSSCVAEVAAHENVALFVCRHFRDAFRAGTVLRARHSCFAAKSLDSFHDALIVGCHNHPVGSFRQPNSLDHPLNHGFSRQRNQGFPG